MIRADCSVCGRDYAVTPRGLIFSHRTPDGARRCPGMGKPPGRGPTGDADIDATLVGVAGGPAPSARHAAHVLRHLGELLRDTRQRRELTQDEAAFQMGLTQAELSRFESGDRPPNHRRLLRILDWIGGAV